MAPGLQFDGDCLGFKAGLFEAIEGVGGDDGKAEFLGPIRGQVCVPPQLGRSLTRQGSWR